MPRTALHMLETPAGCVQMSRKSATRAGHPRWSEKQWTRATSACADGRADKFEVLSKAVHKLCPLASEMALKSSDGMC